MNKRCPPPDSLPYVQHCKVLFDKECQAADKECQVADKDCQAASHFRPHAFVSSLSHQTNETADRVLHIDGRDLLASAPPNAGRLEMRTSEACHKGFVIIDHGEGKSKVILHPSWLNMCPPFRQTPQCSFNIGAGNNRNMLGIPKENVLEVLFGSHSSRSPAYSTVREESTCHVQQKMASEKGLGYTSVDLSKSSHAVDLNDDAKGRLFYEKSIREELQLEFHENTEEINALLSSGYGDDDEDEEDELTSTGRSPTAAFSKCHDGNNNSCANSSISKKRKLHHPTQDEADDADSGPGIAKSVPGPESQHHPPPIKSRSLLSLNAPAAGAVKDPRLLASRSCGTLEGGLSDSSKRLKVRSMVQELKLVVPGGDDLDMAGMLGRTIEYVKCLQRRLREVEATRGAIWG